ncbi:MAG: methionine--tRNA ligase subunit beta [Parcubacteria group bacterium]|nr:methionine--tRNA ligase subunit beta [Parcubacteria group bacterium]
MEPTNIPAGAPRAGGSTSAKDANTANAAPANKTVTIDDFKKLNIRIGKVVSAEKVPDADKLIKIIFDFGGEQRQIMAGIAEFIEDPASLIGKEVPVIVNLAPRMLRGYESQGMMLAADNAGRPTLLHPAEEVPPGSIVK